MADIRHEKDPKARQRPEQDPNKGAKHGEQSEARKGSQPGLTGHSDRSRPDANEGRPLRQKPGSESN
jgi:hypothetical protein